MDREYFRPSTLTLQKALEKYPGVSPRVITDNGSQFVSRDFAEFIKHSELDHIRTSVNYPQSNGKIERFHRTITEDCLTKESMIDLTDARSQISRYIDFYNNKRLHSALFYLTPLDFLSGRVSEKLKVREEKLQRARRARAVERLAS